MNATAARHPLSATARLHVCSLDRVGATVDEIGARWLVTLLNAGTPMTRPPAIRPERHQFIAMSDIVAPLDGHTLPGARHVTALLKFVTTWDQAAPLLIHCYAGVSRSTAAAFIAACALSPERGEGAIAEAIRAASPTATPNALLVATADAMLGRAGRMNAAITAIGRGEACETGVPFGLEVG